MKLVTKTLLAGLACAAIAGPASATVVNFDDLTGQALVADGYGGINWNGNWTYYGYAQDPYNASSGDYRVYDYDKAANFTFASPVIFDGAWFAGKETSQVQFELLLGGSVVATSAVLNLSAVPHYLTPAYAGLVDEVRVLSGQPDYWVMDDVTYHGGPAVPEPATWALMILGFAGIGLSLRGSRKAALAA